MRPLLVLILVAGALAAFFFAFSTGTEPEPQDSLLSGGAQTEEVASTPETSTELQTSDTSSAARGVAPVTDRGAREANKDASQRNLLMGSVVQKESGEPIEGARVVLTKIGRTTIWFTDATEQERSSDRRTTTKKDGTFRFSNVEPYQNYSLIVSHDDYSPVEIGSVKVDVEGTREEPPIQLTTGPSVRGTITDTGGNVVPGARLALGLTGLTLTDPSAPDVMRIESDDAGKFEFRNVAGGNYTMSVSSEGYANATIAQINVTGREDVEKDVVLEVAQLITGRVFGAETNAPIKGATIQVFSMNNRTQTTRTQAVTDSEGNFEIDDVPEGVFTLMVRADGHKAERVQRVQSGDTGMRIQLQRLPQIAGRVVDASTNEPITSFRARLRQPAPDVQTSAPSTDYETFQRADGSFLIHSPRAGTYVVEAVADEYAGCFSEPFSITGRQTIGGIVVRMTKGGQISGVLLDQEGNPIPNAMVASHHNEWSDDAFMASIGDMFPSVCTSRETLSGADGRFTLKALTPATYLIDIKSDNFSRASRQNILVVEGESKDIGEVRLAKGATISGTVFDPSGNPLAGSLVQVTSTLVTDQIPLTFTEKTGADGKYTFSHIPDGTYNIKAMRTSVAGPDPFENFNDIKATQRTLVVKDGRDYKGEDFRLNATGR